MTLERETVYAQVAQLALVGLTGPALAEGQLLVQGLVADWLNATEVEVNDMVRIGTADLAEALHEASSPTDRLNRLRAVVLARQAQQLSGSALQLAKQVIDQPAIASTVTPTAQQLLINIDALLPQVKAIEEPTLQKRLLRELADARLELRYVLDGAKGIMSIRLNRYLQNRAQ